MLYQRHNREYSPFTLVEMFQAAGFEIELIETDSSYPFMKLDYSDKEIADILNIIGIPNLRRDTINICGKKIGPVECRYPTKHDLYLD